MSARALSAPAHETPSTPLVSIVVALHHGADYVPELLRACLAQSERRLEVVIVDPGQDGASSVLVRACDDPRVRVVEAPSHASLAELWNRGLEAARGRAFCCVTECERLEPWAIERLLQALEAAGGAECVYAGHRIRDLSSEYREDVLPPTDYEAACLGRVSKCYLFTRRAYQTVGGYGPNVAPAELLDYWLRLFQHFEAHALATIACESVVYPWRTKDPDWIDLGMMEAAVRWLHGRGPLAALRPWLARYIANVWKSPTGWRELPRWYGPTGRRLARLSPHLALYWAVTSAKLVALRFRRPAGATLDESQTEVMPRRKPGARLDLGRLRFERHAGTQVLVLIPKIVMGGSEKVVSDVVSGLRPRGFRFHLCAERGQRDAWCRAFRREFDNVVECAVNGNTTPDEPDEYTSLVHELIVDLRIDLVLISNAYPAYAALPELRRRFPRLPFVDILHVEGYAGTSPELSNCAGQLDRRVCINDHLRRIMVTQYAASGDSSLEPRLSVIQNGLDFEGFEHKRARVARFRTSHQIPRNALVVASVGRLEREKRPQLFVDVALRLLAQQPHLPVYFVMAGDGIERPRVERRILARGGNERFRLLGVLEHAAVRDLLAEVDVLLITSEVEGLPLVMVEAMAMGVPVISTRVGGVGDVIEHCYNGFLVEPDADLRQEFTRYTSQILCDETLRRTLSSRTRQAVSERFAMPLMHRSYETLFRSLLTAEGEASGRPS